MHGETAAHHGIPSLRFPRTPLPLTGLLPWKTLPEMVMLSTTLGTLTSVSDGKGHTGKVVQHSHAGGSEWLFLYSKHIHKKFSYCSWPALGLDSTYVYIYLGALLPVELSQRHPQDVLCSSTERAEHNYPDIGATQSVQATFCQMGTLLVQFSG